MKHVIKTPPRCMSRRFAGVYMLLCLWAVSLLCPSGTARAKVLPETARLIPSETIVLVDVGNFSQLRQQFEKTNLYKFWKDPAMDAFVSDFKTKWREKVRGSDNEIGKAIVNAGLFPQGRAAFALVFSEQVKDANEPPVLFLTQWGEAIGKIKEAVDKAVEKAVENGAHVKNEDYRGVNVKTVIKKDSSISYCFVDDCLAGSTDIDVLKFVIAHIKGATSPTLAADDDYNAARKATGPYHDIDLYVNIKQIIKRATSQDESGKVKTRMANLGVDNVISLGCSIGVGRRAGSIYWGKTFLKIAGAKKGVCKMLEIEPGILRVPRFVSASACSVTLLNLNMSKVYNELADILKSFSPQYAAPLYMPLLPPSPDGQPGVELKRDIVDHLGSQIVIAQSISKPVTISSGTTETLVALAVNDRRALEKSVSLLHSKMIAPNNPEAKRELLGHTIYLVSLPGMPFFPPGRTPMQGPAGLSAPARPKIALTITDTHLVFGVESTVERVIRALSSTEAASVDSAKWFTSCRSALPSVVGLASLEDSAASFELLWRTIKESEKNNSSRDGSNVSMGVGMSSSYGLVFSQAGLGLFNFKLLPDFDVVSKYFGLSASYGVSRADGFFFEFKYFDSPGTD